MSKFSAVPFAGLKAVPVDPAPAGAVQAAEQSPLAIRAGCLGVRLQQGKLD